MLELDEHDKPSVLDKAFSIKELQASLQQENKKTTVKEWRKSQE